MVEGYFLSKQGETRKETISKFREKMTKIYGKGCLHEIFVIRDSEGRESFELLIYDINHTAVLFNTKGMVPEVHDLDIYGRPKDISNTKLELEEKTGFSLVKRLF